MYRSLSHPSQNLPSQAAALKETKLAWIVIGAFVSITTAAILLGVGTPIRLAYPVLAFFVAIFLYQKHPPFYLGFTWWLYFLSPLATRLVDFRNGWDPQRLMLLAPVLVTLVSIMTLRQNLSLLSRQGGAGFIWPIIGLGYATVIGIINNSPTDALRGLLDWLPFIFFGFHIFATWHYYPEYRQVTQKSFVWATLIMGVYGVYQFLVAPPWDTYWLTQSGMFTSAGNPAPLEIRVWSTMNSPGPFGIAMMAGLLVTLSYQGILLLPASIAGYLSFLLCLVRSAWGGWFVGLLMFLPALKPRLQMRFFITAFVLILCLLPLATMEPFQESITSRVETLSNISDDGSFNSRKKLLVARFDDAMSSFVGQGMSAGGLDSGIIEILFKLGWVGTIFYAAGIVLVLGNLSSIEGSRKDAFVGTARAIAVAIASQFIFGVSFKAFGGLLFWGFASLGLAAKNYYSYEKNGLIDFQQNSTLINSSFLNHKHDNN